MSLVPSTDQDTEILEGQTRVDDLPQLLQRKMGK